MRNLYRFLAALLIAALIWGSLPASPAYAATFTVTKTADTNDGVCDADCSLREAISAANAASGADTVILPAGTYQLTLSGSNDDNTAGDLDITDPLTITGAGAGSTIIQQTIAGERVIHVVSSVSVAISGVTVRGGNTLADGGGLYNNGGTATITNSAFSSNSAGSLGGAIFNAGTVTLTDSTLSNNSAADGGAIQNVGTLNITNSTLSGNSATVFGGGGILNNGGGTVNITNSTFANNSVSTGADGGGIFNWVGTLNIANSTFSGNSAADNGGGIFNLSTVTITNSTFSGNSAASGGGIATSSDVTITSSTFSGNDANGNAFGGGAIYANGGTIRVNESLFENNRANGNGGGAIATNIDFASPTLIVDRSTFRNNFTYGNFGNGGAIGANGDLTITASTFNGNYTSTTADLDGGAVYAINGAIELVNVTMANNRASGSGGGFAFRDNEATLNNVTIASNQADSDNNGTGDGGGIYNMLGNPLILRNSIVALNSDPSGGGVDCAGDVLLTYSLIGNSTGCTLVAGSGNNLIGSNPNLGPLANNGGPTQTRALLTGSPAIDAADPGGSCAATDQRGIGRPFDGNYDGTARCDMGAYEYNLPPPSPSTLPSTGFAMGRQTVLPPQPAEKAYASYSDLRLEIPSLKVNAPIVGVLRSGSSWDVTWLASSVGWLEGSAFPTWAGNTVLTGHVWNADNTPGIFAGLKNLKYGDRFYIHAFGQTYVYEVRENTWLWGSAGVKKVFKHEEKDWVTLLTCEGYNPLTGDYLFRRMVRAVLVEVK